MRRSRPSTGGSRDLDGTGTESADPPQRPQPGSPVEQAPRGVVVHERVRDPIRFGQCAGYGVLGLSVQGGAMAARLLLLSGVCAPPLRSEAVRRGDPRPRAGAPRDAPGPRDRRIDVLLNEGNHLVPVREYGEAIGPFRDLPVHVDAFAASYLWMRRGGRLHVLKGLAYDHRIHDGSYSQATREAITREIAEIRGAPRGATLAARYRGGGLGGGEEPELRGCRAGLGCSRADTRLR